MLKFLVAALSAVNAFYLPGIAPHDFKDGDDVPVYVNALESMRSTLPFDYYLDRFHFCRPETIRAQGESLGSVLMGDRLYNSPIAPKFNQSQDCQVICQTSIPSHDAQFINDRIKEDYQIYWEIDGLPAAKLALDRKSDEEFYQIGFPLGVQTSDGSRVAFNNHYDITINHHTDMVTGSDRIVGVLVEPQSIFYGPGEETACYQESSPLFLDTQADTKVTFTYSVRFNSTTDEWRTRWDKYLHVYDPKIHWFNIINSIVIVLFLTGMLAMILLRALHKDIMKYNQLDTEDAQEDSGWKLIHGDVFRTPPRYIFLSVLIGSGSQLWLMGAVTLFFASIGFLSPSNRGALANTMIVSFVLSAAFGGFVSSRMYKMFGGEDWKLNVVYTATLVPCTVFVIFVLLNFFLLGAGSSSAVPVGTMFALMFLWFLISIPLCFVGSYYGFKKPRIEYPVRTNQIPRQIPEQVYYLKAWPSILMGGILPFGAIFIELYFIMNSLWAHQVYYMFGFLFMVGAVLVVTCAEVTILMCYFHLVAEDYRWWWRSFLTSGASAFYVFLYSIIYFREIGASQNPNSAALYFGWSLVFSMLMFLTTGCIGFLATFWFVRKIFGSIKVD